MAKIWVLDTETKGTGAEMVPLERALRGKRSVPGRERIRVVKRKPDGSSAEAPPTESAPRAPRRFKVTSALSGKVLADDAGVREIVELMDGMRSVADARVYVWEADLPGWRPLSLREQQLLLDRARERRSSSSPGR
jgi:hypothetical protein